MTAAIGILSELIAFPTLSRQSNLALIDYVEDYLAGHGVSARRVYSSDGQRANLYATIGPQDRGGICLSGHSDVVPVAGQPWSSDPFTLTRRGDRLYGRGTADMKGFIACVLALAPRFVQGTRGADARPIHIAISYDEEIGCVGVRGLLDQLARDAVRPTGCIIGEPTMMRIATAHKGKSAWRCTVLGQAAHSSQPQQGVNAIEYAAELIMFLRQRGRDWQEGVSDTRYEPAWSTVQTGTVRGGAVVNVVPDRCEFDFEIRPLPGSDHHLLADELGHFARRQIMPQMRRVAGDANIQLEALSAYPGLRDDASLDALKHRCAAAAEQPGFHALAFGTEAGLFQQAGIPSVVCGPGSIAQAHKADEYIDCGQLDRCQAFLARALGV
ncbi:MULTISPECIES: acetylornithine deacetylase [Brenneria]|uniref:Acetylornithine deacetylase n=1 Tax=Brenneria nigrifluens DSM 30175 = ATCC 13028 TaxID=1121120 RepID=A0A2U1UVZ2_9GAMM|nr:MULTISPECIES: acetylornithine deacetylase [Brenneria]EHD20176.1 acetylornithine deacetylase (ArgE) [Brenneria sp. EniD312]PWC25731.1 acetylornithine deacetylase [Brenneria nigrifluens DSM 30175 = ATCC 13028]QCR03403.1 acetylornithine deacetylase [Brenneria nigrifluens DSM 30175 = ATCC 13028]